MNELDVYRVSNLSWRERRRYVKHLRQIKVIREITILAMESIASVDLAVMELFSDTLEEAEEIAYQQSGYLTSDEKLRIDELTNDYTENLLEIIRSHNNRVLRELKLRGKRLESIDPDWQLLLPSGFLDALKE